MKKFFLILICTILLTCNAFGCTKVNNTQEHTDIISYDKELKKFTIPFRFMDRVKLTESDTYKADITLPSHWMGENPIGDDIGIVFQGFTSLYNIDDDYKFTDSSWKDFRRIDWDFDSMIPSTGMTANGYEYVIYKAPNNETYFCYIKVIPGYASDFSIRLDGIYDTTINEVLDSIKFYK